MKLKEFRNRLEESKEYSNAKKELKLNFDLADAVLKARFNKGWSQEQLAEAIGTKQANISRIEAGLANPTLNVIKKLTNVLEFDIEISCEKIVEIEYESKPKTMISQPFQGFGFPSIHDTCPVFDVGSIQSQTQEKVFA
ncbi:MAG: helix-turn-helix transcriptional regulator [Pelolinea sp.]|nr:helix-turn-helix transcriptional regulator [Pelolinea sp.]